MAATDQLSAAKDRIRTELDRIEESAEYSVQSQFEQAKLWRGINLLFGVPVRRSTRVAPMTLKRLLLSRPLVWW